MKILLTSIIFVILSGCVYSQHTDEKYQGTRVSPQQVALIEAGKTSKQWVLTNLGIPDRTQSDKDGWEVFEYLSERVEKSNKTFIFLFDMDTNKVISRHVTRVVMRDGIVESVSTNDLLK